MTPEGALAIMEPAKRHPAREGWCDCDAMQCPWWQGYAGYAGYAGGATVQPAAFDTAESPKIGKPLVFGFWLSPACVAFGHVFTIEVVQESFAGKPWYYGLKKTWICPDKHPSAQRMYMNPIKKCSSS